MMLTDPERSWIREQIEQMPDKPLFSIVMPVYNPSIKFLKLAIESVLKQLYPYWELCIADDAPTHNDVIETLQACAELDSRIKITYRAKNGRIAAASNSALELARGKWMALLDSHDELSEHALYCVAREINDHPDAKLIYTDEDRITPAGKQFDPYFKPDWNPALLTGQNFFNHLGVYHSDLVREAGGFREEYEGAQDYDLLWRCVEKVKSDQIRHIPRILYHWRVLPSNGAEEMDAKNYAIQAARRAVQDHLDREGIHGHVEACLESMDFHRVVYRVPTPAPHVSVLIPMRDKVHLTQACVQTLKRITRYDNYETIVIDNDSQEEVSKSWLHEFAAEPCNRVIDVSGKFSYSRINNEAVRKSTGEILLFLNNDIEILHEGWMSEMVGQLIQRQVGAVGARLWYSNNTLQHGGIILGPGFVSTHLFRGSVRGEMRPFARNVLCQNFSAVTGACLAVKREYFNQVGGFNETDLPVQYNDVDLCLRLREAGYDVVWTPHAELIHHESRSRGYNTTPEQMNVEAREANYMKRRWTKWIEHDPANPSLTKVSRLHFPGQSVKQDRFCTQIAQMPPQLTITEELVDREFLYERMGYDSRPMSFLKDGRIGEGAAGCELFWDVKKENGKMTLVISGEREVTCRLVQDEEGIWNGRWERFEQMPVRLI
jgi:glycosyltransferase involved in cell wall biosynthesis